jgi:hypothetical protein
MAANSGTKSSEDVDPASVNLRCKSVAATLRANSVANALAASALVSGGYRQSKNASSATAEMAATVTAR